jgi:hypothetical protein
MQVITVRVGVFWFGRCVLVPRTSSTPVATWSWPTWVVESETCLVTVFILLE